MNYTVSRMAILPLTLPASWLYRLAVAVHNSRHETGRAEIHRLPHPIISVGNLTVGGSGKTPLVAFLARHLIGRRQRVAVLSRGYRRRDSHAFRMVSDGRDLLADVDEAGDEPVELAQSIEGLVVAVGPHRFQAAMEVVRRFGPHVFILDDGFQHRRLFRNLDLVCIDAGEPVIDLHLLPAGRLREPLKSLNRASGIIWTRWRKGLPYDSLASRVLASLHREIPVFRARQKTLGFTRLGERAETLAAGGLEGEPVGILAAVARPRRFEEDLSATGAHVICSATRRDHHSWQPAEVVRFLEKARSRGARAVVTTGKDAVKLQDLRDLPLPLYRMDIHMEILESRAFDELVDSVLAT